jgi:YHS domain-containing protein
MTMKESRSVTKDPICGMNVGEATALHTERDGKTFYFCGDHCRPSACVAPRLRDSRFLGVASNEVNLRTRRSQRQQTKIEQAERRTKL